MRHSSTELVNKNDKSEINKNRLIILQESAVSYKKKSVNEKNIFIVIIIIINKTESSSLSRASESVDKICGIFAT